MVSAVIPVKDLKLAKMRLAGVLSEAQRRSLVLAFLRMELEVLRQVAGIGELIVVTPDDEVGRIADASGARIVAERGCLGYSGAVDLAAQALAQGGSKAMMILPADLPLMTGDEVGALIAAHPRGGRAVTIVPDRAGLGTNALICSPPTVMPFGYGPGSFRRHVRQAHGLGIAVRTRILPGIGLDIDTPMDLAALCGSGPTWLRGFAEIGLEEAMARMGGRSAGKDEMQ